MQNELAIIVPAYKSDYLKEALTSIINQSDQRFNLYIFDDSSPELIIENLENMALPQSTKIHRFEENLGRKSIVAHWHRCIAMTMEEKWIWLFSDDDLMDMNCVSAFYKALENGRDSVAYRFNTHKISDDGSFIRKNIFTDDFTASSFLNQKLTYSQESYVVETIFSRKGFEAVGGIPDLPLAWASDDLFNVKLALYGNVSIIQDALVYWRYSGKNISADKNKRSSIQKLKASRMFVKWICQRQELLSGLKPKDLPVRWYVRQIRTLQNDLSLLNELMAVIKLSTFDSRVWILYFKMKWDKSRIIAWLKRY